MLAMGSYNHLLFSNNDVYKSLLQDLTSITLSRIVLRWEDCKKYSSKSTLIILMVPFPTPLLKSGIILCSVTGADPFPEGQNKNTGL